LLSLLRPGPRSIGRLLFGPKVGGDDARVVHHLDRRSPSDHPTEVERDQLVADRSNQRHVVLADDDFATLVEALVERGHTVRVLDNFSTGDPANLQGVREQVRVLDGDITDLTTVQAAVQGVEVVFHQAALASVPRSVADPMATHQACVNGTLHVLLAARDARVRRVVYAASSSAYGGSRKASLRRWTCLDST